jgi:hypothetical protein
MNPKIFFGELKRRNAYKVVTPFVFEYRDDPRFVALCQKLGVQLPGPGER